MVGCIRTCRNGNLNRSVIHALADVVRGSLTRAWVGELNGSKAIVKMHGTSVLESAQVYRIGQRKWFDVNHLDAGR
jgi:hypothetical protein